MLQRYRTAGPTEPSPFHRGLGNAVSYAIGKIGNLISPKQSDVARFHDRVMDEPPEKSLKRPYESSEEPSEPTPAHSQTSETSCAATSTSFPPCGSTAGNGTAKKRTKHLTPFNCRFVTARDGRQDYAALLLNSEAMEPLQRRAALSQTRCQLITTVADTEDELSALKSLIRTHEPEMGNCGAENEQHIADLVAKKREAQEKQQKILDLDQDIKQLDREVECCHAEIFHHLDGALEEAGFLHVESTESGSEPSPGRSENSRVTRPRTDSSVEWERSHGFDDQRKYVPGAFTIAGRRLKAAESEFHDRHNMYFDNKHEWQRQRELGETQVKSIAFDRWYLEQVQKLTREFIEAEEAYEEAKRVAREKGEWKADEFGFETFSQQSYGYPASVEDRMISHAPTEKVHTWLRGMDSDGAPAQPSIPNAPARAAGSDDEGEPNRRDDWMSQVQSMDFGSGISMLDDGFNRKLIEQWQRKCGRNGR